MEQALVHAQSHAPAAVAALSAAPGVPREAAAAAANVATRAAAARAVRALRDQGAWLSRRRHDCPMRHTSVCLISSSSHILTCAGLPRSQAAPASSAPWAAPTVTPPHRSPAPPTPPAFGRRSSGPSPPPHLAPPPPRPPLRRPAPAWPRTPSLTPALSCAWPGRPRTQRTRHSRGSRRQSNRRWGWGSRSTHLAA